MPWFVPTRDTNLLQKKYTQIYYIWVWNCYFFTCTFTLNILPIYLLLVILMLTGFAVAGVRTSRTSHFTIGQSFSRFVCPTDKAIWNKTRQIWGIWKLRPAYSPETPNLGQNRWCFVLCDLEIWWMTLENNRASLLCCITLCATFHSHWWIQTGVTVRKRPIWVKFDDF